MEYALQENHTQIFPVFLGKTNLANVCSIFINELAVRHIPLYSQQEARFTISQPFDIA